MQLVMADQQLLLLNNFSFASVFTACSTGRKQEHSLPGLAQRSPRSNRLAAQLTAALLTLKQRVYYLSAYICVKT
jgi:hypothetical protein